MNGESTETTAIIFWTLFTRCYSNFFKPYGSNRALVPMERRDMTVSKYEHLSFASNGVH